jgi:hypothetical protein
MKKIDLERFFMEKIKEYDTMDEFLISIWWIVYHWTNKKFDTFDKSQIWANYQVDKIGFFFTDSINDAFNYANDAVSFYKEWKPYVMERYLLMKKPYLKESYYTNAQQSFDLMRDRWDIEKIIKDWYDWIIIKNIKVPENELMNAWRWANDGWNLYMVISPSQIKTINEISDIRNTKYY